MCVRACLCACKYIVNIVAEDHSMYLFCLLFDRVVSLVLSLSLHPEHGIAFPVDLTVQHRAAVARQKTLTAQVAMEKQLPLMRELHLPDIARLSAKLYTTTTGKISQPFLNLNLHLVIHENLTLLQAPSPTY